MFDVLAFGERLRFLRERRNWSQREASLAMNWTAASWRDLEAGQKMAKCADAVLICEEFKAPVEWLISGDTDRLDPELKTAIDRRISDMMGRLKKA